jgi:hypothetical protein
MLIRYQRNISESPPGLIRTKQFRQKSSTGTYRKGFYSIATRFQALSGRRGENHSMFTRELAEVVVQYFFGGIPAKKLHLAMEAEPIFSSCNRSRGYLSAASYI